MSASGVKLLVQGRNACFNRPEMKVERASYDVITPSAARGLIEAIHWKPAIRWVIGRLHILHPIRFEAIRRDEVASGIPASAARGAMGRNDPSKLGLAVDGDRQQRAMLCLADVVHGIEAHFEMTGKARPEDNPGKHAVRFGRRAAKGQCYH